PLGSNRGRSVVLGRRHLTSPHSSAPSLARSTELGSVDIVRPHHRRRRNEYLECGIAFEQGSFQPLQLLSSPHGFVLVVRHASATILATLSHPNLQILR